MHVFSQLLFNCIIRFLQCPVALKLWLKYIMVTRLAYVIPKSCITLFLIRIELWVWGRRLNSVVIAEWWLCAGVWLERNRIIFEILMGRMWSLHEFDLGVAHPLWQYRTSIGCISSQCHYWQFYIYADWWATVTIDALLPRYDNYNLQVSFLVDSIGSKNLHIRIVFIFSIQ